VFHSSYGMVMLYRFRDKQRFRTKIANFPTVRVFNARDEGVPLELYNAGWAKKN